jgi:hypothetical protein
MISPAKFGAHRRLLMHQYRRAALAALALAATLPAIPSMAEPFGPVHVAVNRHEYHGRGCPIEVLFTGTINFTMPHPKGFSMSYFWERSDGAKSEVHDVRPGPNQRSLVVRDPWKLGGPGFHRDVHATLHVNSGNTHIQERSPQVLVDCH